MTRDSGLETWLQAARGDALHRVPDPLVEQQLLARIRERRALKSVAAVRMPARESKGSPWWRRWSFAVPAALAGLLVILFVTPPPASLRSPSAVEGAATPFFALAGIDAIAAERVPIVVSSRVPRAALADYGLPVDPGRVDEPVNAEFLMTRAGVVLAVRFRE